MKTSSFTAVDVLRDLMMAVPSPRGDVVHHELANMMLAGKQGSEGIETALCSLCGWTRITSKHGFDGTGKTGQVIELKPTRSMQTDGRVTNKLKMMFNDVCDEKIRMLKDVNVFVCLFALNQRGQLMAAFSVHGADVAKWLTIHRNLKKKRQTYTIALSALRKMNVKINVLFYRSDLSDLSPQVTKKYGIVGDVNRLTCDGLVLS